MGLANESRLTDANSRGRLAEWHRACRQGCCGESRIRSHERFRPDRGRVSKSLRDNRPARCLEQYPNRTATVVIRCCPHHRIPIYKERNAAKAREQGAFISRKMGRFYRDCILSRYRSSKQSCIRVKKCTGKAWDESSESGSAWPRPQNVVGS